jgi:hypothetical protein
VLVETPGLTEKRLTFFRYLFPKSRGFIRVARRNPHNKAFEEEFFKWPDEAEKMGAWIATNIPGHDLYFSPMLFARPQGNKESVDICTCAWADLDSCHPSNLLVEPTITIESSTDRYQALWCFEGEVDPAEAEDVSRRIAYKHADQGADKSGWDLTQLLRIPWSNNHKYRVAGLVPEVKVLRVGQGSYTLDQFDQYPQAKGYEFSAIPFPEDDVLSKLDSDQLLETYKFRLMPSVWHLIQTEPDEDWSKALWQLQMLLFEGGMTREEVFVVSNAAACNKYNRDNKSPVLLWKEVCRAFQSFESRHSLVAHSVSFKDALLSDEERRWCEGTITVVEEYIEWAKDLGDAAWQYHQAGAFVILSSLLAGNVRLPTSYGTVVPNLWFMILADTTLTRKTTAMDVAMDLIADIDSDAVLATDGSIEGLFTSLSMRPGRPSIFLRDEFSGLLEAITKKDYYAGMAETLTKLYDGKFQKRVLRKEVIEVRDPVLIVFAGGIRERTLSLLSYEHVASGFLPRFIFITAESDITRLRPLGPPTDSVITKKDYLTRRFTDIASHYRQQQQIQLNGRAVLVNKVVEAEMSQDAWARYNKFEAEMLTTGLDSFHADILTPCFDRLAKSGLKVATLIAAARRLEERVVIDESDMVKAFQYVEQWREHTLAVLNNIGKTTQEKIIAQIFAAIVRKPGVMRSELMQFYHLTARDANMILDTLEQRGVVTRAKQGRTERLFPIGGSQ